MQTPTGAKPEAEMSVPGGGGSKEFYSCLYLFSKHFYATRSVVGTVLTVLQILTHFIVIVILCSGCYYFPHSTMTELSRERLGDVP